MNRVGDYALIIAILASFFVFGSLDFSIMFSLAPYINENAITIICLLLFIGASAKSAQLGLHS
jgi:NADH-ubiquinone oxidoreductase chain 5